MRLGPALEDAWLGIATWHDTITEDWITHLVGGWPTPLNNRKVNWDDDSQYMGKYRSHVPGKPPTSNDYDIFIHKLANLHPRSTECFLKCFCLFKLQKIFKVTDGPFQGASNLAKKSRLQSEKNSPDVGRSKDCTKVSRCPVARIIKEAHPQAKSAKK